MLALQSTVGNHALQRALAAAAGPQRRCACGGIVGPSGECVACRARRLAGDQAAVGLREAGPEEDATDTELQVLLDSDTGQTHCNLNTGRTTTTNRNPTCSRPCTQAHENQHVADVSDCCAEASRAYRAARDAAEKERIAGRFTNWMKVESNAALECRAYAAGVACNDAMWDQRGCNDKPKDRCCADLSSYRSNWERQRQTFCGASGGAAPSPCPFPEPIEPSAMPEDLEDQPWRRPYGPPPII